MSKKAVYSNKGLQVYITGEDFEKLLQKWTLNVPLHIGKVEAKDHWIVVKTLSWSNDTLGRTLAAEQSAIDEARKGGPVGNVPYIKSLTKERKR